MIREEKIIEYINLEQNFFGGTFDLDVLEPCLSDLITYNISNKKIRAFLMLLLTECRYPQNLTIKKIIIHLEMKNIQQLEQFILDMKEIGRKIRKKRDKTNKDDIFYVADSFLEFFRNKQTITSSPLDRKF
jgi:hypothetical protein